MRRLLVCFCLLSACNERDLQSISLTRSTEWVAGTLLVEGPAKVDVLLVVDDSPSMHDHAEQLADNLEHIARVYFVLVDGVDACVGWLSSTWTTQACLAPGLGAEAIIVRREESWETLEYEVTCAADF